MNSRVFIKYGDGRRMGQDPKMVKSPAIIMQFDNFNPVNIQSPVLQTFFFLKEVSKPKLVTVLTYQKVFFFFLQGSGIHDKFKFYIFMFPTSEIL